MRWRTAVPCLALVTACHANEESTPAPPPPPSAALTLPANRRDSAATLDSLKAFAARVDRDTATMTRIQRQLDLGAGSTGLLTAWRAGSAWQRLRVDASGTGFQTSDTYWLHDGTLVSAHLELTRPKQRTAADQVWFRGADLYRWIDAEGRHLSTEARSTTTEVTMLRARVDRILTALRAMPLDETVR